MRMIAGRLKRLLPWLPLVSTRSLRGDFMAGLTGAVIVLPQGIAYAMIAGLPPQYGLYTAIVLPIVAGLLGSSRHMVSGPVAPNSVLVASVLAGLAAAGSSEYIALAVTLAFLCGLFQVAFGLARLGMLVNFISNTVVVGFTAAAALTIVASQWNSLLGLPAGSPHGWAALEHAFAPENLSRTLAGLGLFTLTVAVYVLIKRLRPRWPALLISMLAAGAVAWLLAAPRSGVPMVGAMPASLPPLSTPVLSLTMLRELVPGALAVATLGLIQAISVSRAIATRSRQPLDSNREFIGQGASNMVGSFFSCYPGSGSLTRSGLNYEAGASTPLAGVFASVVLALILISIPGVSAYLPIPVVAGVIVVIAWGLFDFAAIRRILRYSREETVVLVATFLAGLVVSLEFSIAIGVLLSLVFYLRQVSHPRVVPVAPHPDRPGQGLRNAVKHELPEFPELRILRIDGSLFFGAVDHVERALQQQTAEDRSKRVLLVCNAVNLIDMAGAEMLIREAERLQAAGGALYLSGLRDQPRRMLDRMREGTALTDEYLFGDPTLALTALLPDWRERTRAAALAVDED